MSGDPDFAGYHGTSLWALIYAAKFGALPNRSPRDRLFYYLPRDYPDALEEAKQYALNNSTIHFVREFVPYATIDDVYAALDRGDANAESTVEGVIEEALGLRGVVISLGRSVADLRAAEAPVNERCIHVPRGGLPVKHIRHAQPLGPRDREILGDRGLI